MLKTVLEKTETQDHVVSLRDPCNRGADASHTLPMVLPVRTLFAATPKIGLVLRAYSPTGVITFIYPRLGGNAPLILCGQCLSDFPDDSQFGFVAINEHVSRVDIVKLAGDTSTFKAPQRGELGPFGPRQQNGRVF